MHDNGNNLSLARHPIKNDLYTCYSNIHAIPVDFSDY